MQRRQCHRWNSKQQRQGQMQQLARGVLRQEVCVCEGAQSNTSAPLPGRCWVVGPDVRWGASRPEDVGQSFLFFEELSFRTKFMFMLAVLTRGFWLCAAAGSTLKSDLTSARGHRHYMCGGCNYKQTCWANDRIHSACVPLGARCADVGPKTHKAIKYMPKSVGLSQLQLAPPDCTHNHWPNARLAAPGNAPPHSVRRAVCLGACVCSDQRPLTWRARVGTG